MAPHTVPIACGQIHAAARDRTPPLPRAIDLGLHLVYPLAMRMDGIRMRIV
jgi:hypothetical protein